jgi:branched-chain amino acid transport system substrate-binding protein
VATCTSAVRRARQGVSAVGVASLAAVLLPACSTGPSSTGRPAATTSCNSPDLGVTAQTINVGAIFPSSGPQGSFFKAVGSGIRARFYVANQSGGIAGRQLVLHTADDGDGSIENRTAAQYLVGTTKVFGVIEASTNSDGSAPYLAASHVPVTGWAITPAWGRDPNMFGYGLSTSPLPTGEPVTRAAQFMKAQGATRVAVLGGGASASISYATNFIKTLGPVGLTLAYQNLNEPLGQADFSYDVQAMKSLGVDALFTGMDPTANVNIFEAAQRIGLTFKSALLPAGYDSRLAAAYGKVLEGAVVEVDWRPFELPVPAHQEFKDALRAVAPTEFPGQLAMVGWLSANLFILGLQKAGAACPTRAAFIQNLRQVKGYTADGLLPPTDFSQVFGEMPTCYWEVRIHDSQFVPVGAQPYCGVLLKDYHR